MGIYEKDIKESLREHAQTHSDSKDILMIAESVIRDLENEVKQLKQARDADN